MDKYVNHAAILGAVIIAGMSIVIMKGEAGEIALAVTTGLVGFLARGNGGA